MKTIRVTEETYKKVEEYVKCRVNDNGGVEYTMGEGVEKMICENPGVPAAREGASDETVVESRLRGIEMHLNRLSNTMKEMYKTMTEGIAKGGVIKSDRGRPVMYADGKEAVIPMQKFHSEKEVREAGLSLSSLMFKRDPRIEYTKCRVCGDETYFDGKCYSTQCGVDDR